MNVDSQRHDGAADVEIVCKGEDGHKQVAELKSHVVKELHCLVLVFRFKIKLIERKYSYIYKRELTSRSPGHRSEYRILQIF